MTILRFASKALVIADDAIEKVLEQARRAAQSGAPVLIYGESGTGKELIARFIHQCSARKERSFVSVNCAAIPETLMEAEFFGFERGAFTGAFNQRIGKFERAQGGTLLLDEVSEMPVTLQSKLLRVLQEGEIDRLGGRETVPVDCRVIATTNRDLGQRIREKAFRSDLFYRLNVLSITCPPLRGRPSAIETLALAFLEQACERHTRSLVKLTDKAMQMLVGYAWPGNVRQLQNVIERAVVNSDASEIDCRDLHLEEAVEETTSARNDSLASLEQDHILRVLKKTGGNREEAAGLLGITSRTLRTKLRLYGV